MSHWPGPLIVCVYHASPAIGVEADWEAVTWDGLRYAPVDDWRPTSGQSGCCQKRRENMLTFARTAATRITGIFDAYTRRIGYLPRAPRACPCASGSSIRVDSRYATRKKMMIVPTRATTGFGCWIRIRSRPPFAIWPAGITLRR